MNLEPGQCLAKRTAVEQRAPSTRRQSRVEQSSLQPEDLTEPLHIATRQRQHTERKPTIRFEFATGLMTRLTGESQRHEAGTSGGFAAILRPPSWVLAHLPLLLRWAGHVTPGQWAFRQDKGAGFYHSPG